MTTTGGAQHRRKTINESVPSLAVYFCGILEHAEAWRRAFVKGAIAGMVKMELADWLSASSANAFGPVLYIAVAVSAAVA